MQGIKYFPQDLNIEGKRVIIQGGGKGCGALAGWDF